MTWKALVTLAILAGPLGLAASIARAELPPGSYDKLRAEAEEALILEVESVKTEDRPRGWVEVVATARVVAVERSKAGLKKGGKLTIRYERFDTTKGPAPLGARPIPLLKAGEVYPAFLNEKGPLREFVPAAYGESFSMRPEG